ncbi:hypothetical protein PUN28_001282 [Cardiocondyla obscurior]|uniref:Uncharacterized protein n=1 Tax=Cardiocondyla obscurior TaxID=286306 RepID=A0AAW2H4X1_9HYME
MRGTAVAREKTHTNPDGVAHLFCPPARPVCAPVAPQLAQVFTFNSISGSPPATLVLSLFVSRRRAVLFITVGALPRVDARTGRMNNENRDRKERSRKLGRTLINRRQDTKQD